ncbi:MAG: hypothetical protein M3463_09595, partial [Verrucomicrobiota bacterium]|nr:hypothetical protein [Verrucomicrobiota bacterium]
PKQERSKAIAIVFSELARQDPGKARRALEKFADPADRQQAMAGYVRGLASVDPRAAFEFALSAPEVSDRGALLREPIDQAAKQGTTPVREMLARVSDPALRRGLLDFAAFALSHQSKENPLPWMIEEASSQSSSRGSQSYMWASYLAKNLVAHDPVGGAEWALSLPKDGGRRVLENLFGMWAWVDSKAMLNWLAEKAPAAGSPLSARLSEIMVECAKSNPAQLHNWAEKLPPGTLRDHAQFQLALQHAGRGDLERARASYESVAPSDHSGELAKQFAKIFTAGNASAAAEWSLQRSEGPSRQGAIAVVAQEWARQDPGAAAAWIDRLPAGATRDAAIREYAAVAAHADGPPAAAWVEQVSDPAIRAQATEKLFFVWSREAPRDARAWLRGLTGVDEQWKADFLRRVR